MRKLILCTLFAAASCGSASSDTEKKTVEGTATAATSSLSVIDEKNGFRELKFGQDRATIPDLVEMPGREYVAIKDFQKLPGKEKLQVGNAEVRDITYGFYQNKLVRVTLTVLGDNTEKLLNAAIGLYGEPVQDSQISPPARAYWWTGNKVTGSYQETGREGKLGYLVLSDKQAMAIAENQNSNPNGAAAL